MNKILHVVYCVLIVTIVLSAHSAQATLNIPRLESKITVDGKLQEPAWQQAAEQSLSHVVVPFNIDKLPVKTTVKYFEDGDQLHIAFIAQLDEPKQVRAFYRQRDNIWQDDMVGVKIDPYNDKKLAFQFFVNPLGVQSDATENTISGSESTGWDGIWYSAGQINADNYVVELSLPLNNFNFPETQGPQTWAFEFVRFHPRDVKYRLSSIDIDPDNYCWVCQMQAISGFEGAKPSNRLILVPGLVAGVDQQKLVSNDWDSESETQASLDAKFSIGSDSSLNITLNPDFSQIEADSGQLSINDNFTLFFDEKRPFFLENLDIFETYSDLLYTRNITAPNIGAKLSGRAGQHAYGVFVADDDFTTVIVPGNLSSSVAQLHESSTNMAIRYRYDANADLSVGSLTTVRQGDDYHNYLTSVDMRYYLTDQDSINVQSMLSNTQYSSLIQQYFAVAQPDQCEIGQCVNFEQYLRSPTDQSISGNASIISYQHQEQTWDLDFDYLTVSDGFRADLGFSDTVDLQGYGVTGGLNFYPKADPWWNEIRLEVENEFQISGDQQVLERSYDIQFEISGIYDSNVRLRCINKGQVGNRLDPTTLALKNNTDFFIQNRCSFNAGLTAWSGLDIDVRTVQGDRIDRSNNRLGESRLYQVNLDYFINQQLSSKLNVKTERLDAAGANVYEAEQYDLRLAYNFDSRQALRLSVIYTDVKYNQANYIYQTPDARYKDLGTQLIYSFKVNPQTAFYLGYSDAAANLDFQDLQQYQRSLFAKVSYAWRP